MTTLYDTTFRIRLVGLYHLNRHCQSKGCSLIDLDEVLIYNLLMTKDKPPSPAEAGQAQYPAGGYEANEYETDI